MKSSLLRLLAKPIAAVACLLAIAACGAQVAGRQASPRAAAPRVADNAERGILIAYFTLGRNADYAADVDASTSASLVATGNGLCGTTEYIARLIQQNVGGDLHSIMVKNPYPADFNAVIRQNHAEAAARADIELSSADVDMSKYSTVFVGFPVWASGAPRAIFSFLSGYDLSGKTVVPFCTHDGYGSGRSFREIAEAAGAGATSLEGIAIDAKEVLASSRAVTAWLERIGVKAR